MKYEAPIHVRSSFSDAPGTWVVDEYGAPRSVTVTGVAHDENEVRVTLVGVEDAPGMAASLLGPLVAEHVGVDIIIQNASSAAGKTDVTFTVTHADLARTRKAIERVAIAARAAGVRYDEDVVKVSIVGLGMRSHPGVAARMFRLLADHGINIQAISTSEVKISCLIAKRHAEIAARALHDGFGLGGEPAWPRRVSTRTAPLEGYSG
jgi:aspartate kinase